MDVNVKDHLGNTPMDDALENGRVVAVRMLRERGGRSGNEDKLGAKLYYACAQGSVEEVSRVLSAGLDPNHADYDHR